jgi:hypothetical protein
MPKSDLLAVAFTDLNGNDKYNQGKDTLIATLEDTNNDGVASVGDTVHWGAYPAIPDGSASGRGGTYQSPDDTVTDVLIDDGTGLAVHTADGGTVFWFANSTLEEVITSNTGNGNIESHLLDSITDPTIPDEIFTDPEVFGPGDPNFPVFESTFQLGDQGFLDVKIFSGDDLL